MAFSTVRTLAERIRNLLWTRFRFGLRGLRRHRLIDLQVCHFQLPQKIQDQAILFGREIPLRFFVEGIEHIDQLAGGVGINHRLASTRVRIGAQNHSRIAAQHTYQILERG